MAGSATITGRQNYVLGIGHPKTDALSEGAPAVFSEDGRTANGSDGVGIFADRPIFSQIGSVDIMVYGATPAGLFAAMRASDLGASVIVVEPTGHIGGMLTSGIAKTDYRIHASYRAAMGGLTSDFFKECAHIAGQESFAAQYDDQWNYPCQVFALALDRMLSRRKIPVYTNYRLLDSGAVQVVSGEIIGATVTNDLEQVTIKARQYISAHYHPDLGRQAGVTYTYGRDAAATYSETGAGVTAASLTFTGIDPYIVAGNPASGLLPGVTNLPLPTVGTANATGMWDCYRIVVTNDPALRLPFPQPSNYDATQYELLARWIVQGGGPQTLSDAITRYTIKTDAIPGVTVAAGKLIQNWNNLNISFNKVGGYPNYWNATAAQREAMDADLEQYTLGIIKFLKEDSRVPTAIKTEISDWGMLANEPLSAIGLPPLAYRRESGRMTSARYVVTRNDMEGSRTAPNPIAWGCYNWDIHFCGAWFDGGVIKIEGLMAGSPTNRYGIDIGALLPSPTIVRNFIEAVCIGCSHVAWGSIRVEPTLMSIGEAAGAIAGLAVSQGLQVSGVSSETVKQVVGFAQHKPQGLMAITGTSNLTSTSQVQTYGTIALTGQWDYEAAPIGWPEGASGCFHDRAGGKGSKTVTYTPDVAACGGAGLYEIYVTAPSKWSADTLDSESVPVTVNANGVAYPITCDFLRGDWQTKLLGTFRIAASGTQNVIVSNTGTTGRLRVSAVEFRRIGA